MIQVKLFGNLRDYVSAAQVAAEGETVRGVLANLCTQHSDLQQALFNNEGLMPHVRVMVNGRDIEMAEGLDTPLKPTDKLSIFPPIAGG